MKLSDAIRKGAEQHPQGFGALFRWNSRNNVTSSCALGAAIEGYFGQAKDVSLPSSELSLLTAASSQYAHLVDAFPILHSIVTVPDLAGSRMQLDCAITILNDTCRWSRERIADWVETMEDEHEII